VSLAGVAMNFLFAVIVFAGVAWVVGGLAKGVEVVEIAPDSPASIAGLLPGDRIVEVNGVHLSYTEYLQPLLEESKSEEIAMVVVREGDSASKLFRVTPRENPPEGEGAIGIVFSSSEIYEPSLLAKPFAYGKYGIDKTYFLSVRILKGLGGIFEQASGGEVPQGVGGPLTVTAVLAEFVRFGLLPLLEFTAVISVNLALINLIPFPPLDGSRVVLILAEGLTGRKLAPKIEVYIQTAGMIVLVGLVFALTATEIPKLWAAGSLSGFVESVLGV
jgi:regulator of sigma E protease